MVGVVVAALCASGLAAGAPAAAQQPTGNEKKALPDLVNPFIGTRNDGNTFPGAAVPFGMVQLSPDTGHTTGYDWDDKEVRGFSAVHLSGVGCGLGGDLPVLPTTGEVKETDNEKYAASFSHDNESASAGSYGVQFDDYGGTEAELTATERTGKQRYTFPSTKKANVLLNTGQALHEVKQSRVRVLDNHTVETTITGQGFCQDTKEYTLHTRTHFDRPFESTGTWAGEKVTAGGEQSEGGGKRGAYVRFDTSEGDRDVEATTAISYVDAAGAARNLRAEGGNSFDEARKAARATWQERLSQVRVDGGSEERGRTFYSSLYRALLHPGIGEDVDRRYHGWDGETHRARGHRYYQTFSLWDTYRTQAQLLSLLAPQEMRDMALSLLDVDRQGGWLPKWSYGPVETNIMTGDPVTPFLTNAWEQGLLKGHEEEVYRALKKNADGVPPADSPYVGRMGNEQYLKDGYVPYLPDKEKEKPGDSDFEHGASATLEYALSDSVLARMARGLGHEKDAARYAKRARNYRTVYDSSTTFFRARDGEGKFAGPKDPAKSEGFHEGTSWQYMWLVPQDVPDLMHLIGGKDATEQRLDSFFAYDELLKDPEHTAREVWVNGPYDYYNADKYNPQNEPDLIAPYRYLSTGTPWKTTDTVHAALTLFTDGPDGVTGNDDLGTMSSWMVLASIGVYPLYPGTDMWGLTTPVFDKVELSLDPRWYPRGHLSISADGTNDTDRYVQSAEHGGTDLSRTWLTTDDLRRGDLSFDVGDEPSRWGTGPHDGPDEAITGR